MSGPEPEVIAGRFELLAPLARGNMREVYRARDLADGDTVAVKLMRRRRSGEQVSLTEADKNAARFAREVRIMQRLSSENLPHTIDGGLDGDLPYLAMEYITGDTLDTLLAEADDGLLPVAWAAAIGAQIARGLDAAHRAGVVHRDFKPSNVMLAADGVVKVLDFGVGLILDEAGRITVVLYAEGGFHGLRSGQFLRSRALRGWLLTSWSPRPASRLTQDRAAG